MITLWSLSFYFARRSIVRQQECDEIFYRTATVRHGWHEIRDGVIQGLHVDQESIKFFQR